MEVSRPRGISLIKLITSASVILLTDRQTNKPRQLHNLLGTANKT